MVPVVAEHRITRTGQPACLVALSATAEKPAAFLLTQVAGNRGAIPDLRCGDPSQPSMWEMSVKSWINHPSGGGPVRAGRVVIDGVAFGGMRGVRRVDLSVDGGITWQNIPFIGPKLGQYAWRQFALPVNLERGMHSVVSRAVDDAGNIQSAERPENHRGYANTSWRDHAVNLAVE